MQDCWCCGGKKKQTFLAFPLQRSAVCKTYTFSYSWDSDSGKSLPPSTHLHRPPVFNLTFLISYVMSCLPESPRSIRLSLPSSLDRLLLSVSLFPFQNIFILPPPLSSISLRLSPSNPLLSLALFRVFALSLLLQSLWIVVSSFCFFHLGSRLPCLFIMSKKSHSVLYYYFVLWHSAWRKQNRAVTYHVGKKSFRCANES